MLNFDCDGFYGTLFAIEGISDGRAVLNGPTGCRGHPAYFSDRVFSRNNPFKKINPEEFFFFGLPRIPLTYLDADDYIAGSGEKLEAILPKIADMDGSFIAIVNSPGASLIGDDLNRFLRDAGLQERCMAFESSSYSETVAAGFDAAIVSVLKWLKLNRLPGIKKRINLLGLSIYHKHWEGTRDELVKICMLMGLDVISSPGAGSSVAEMKESASASFNVIVFPEYSERTAGWYEDELGIPSIRSPHGAPVGFSATEEWINTIADATGADPEPALDYIKEMRRIAFHKLGRFYNERGFPKGMTFSVEADASIALPLVRWLYEYLNMFPVSVSIKPESDAGYGRTLCDFLESNSIGESLRVRPDDVPSDVFVGEGLKGSILRNNGLCLANIDIANRSGDYIDVVPKTHLGGAGALYLLEQILNAANRIRYKNFLNKK
ncbi:oxidoreductase/nitrogenase component 1 [Methanolacinia petrolearia DSM 11571]|uniref:Oxidoreductase/nitrogenase component 1 n=1 Tax=Methanolacinia petrolearia (strain DSM 11571 / OCM 486 / SEBR 4847) TaxID=679926 RepID=E1RKP7_METP4|nr:nitrogenase component 1 [Methanolacinia petrolearia]ADN36986.1 oxidoreductase/nitrogenase component 1 [Methanolacinia petrolearia DSM 11571]